MRAEGGAFLSLRCPGELVAARVDLIPGAQA